MRRKTDKLNDKLNNEKQPELPANMDAVTIVYDGECPFCQQFMQLLRLRASAGNVHLIDARSNHPLVDEIVQLGFDLDQGMIVVIGERYYHGSEAMQVLAMLSTRKGWFNRLNYYIFRSKGMSTTLYPILRTGRNLVLKLLGRKPINL